MLGDYKASGGVITFTPRFQPSPGVALNVSFKPAGGSELSATFGEPARAVVSTTKVVGIHPSADVWPANTLRMYVEFSAPMVAGEAYDRILVRDDQGRLIEGPFVEIDQELWDPSGTRLTILFDPGRIKRGLVDNEASGPPLMPGRTVTIEIDPAWRDATGASLTETFSRTIRVTEPLRDPIDPKAWKVDPPKSESDPLVIAFGRPLDHALALRTIQIARDGSTVAGDASLEEKDTRLRFKPSAPWAGGRYTVLIDGILEDIAGNRPGKAFDVDTSDPTQSTSATPSTSIEFSFPPG
jgi:hypothetical protein